MKMNSVWILINKKNKKILSRNLIKNELLKKLITFLYKKPNVLII